MLEQTGFVKGIRKKKHSRYLTDPRNQVNSQQHSSIIFLMIGYCLLTKVAITHRKCEACTMVTVHARKCWSNMVFVLPSALDNRPLKFEEFDRHINQVDLRVGNASAYELEHSPEPAQQIIRPTGLLDP